MSTDPKAAYYALFSKLTGPGGQFEMVQEDVLGGPLTMMKNRGSSLADVV